MEHQENENKLASLKKAVETATSEVKSSPGITSNDNDASSNSLLKSMSPTSIASQLFHRGKTPKARHSSSSTSKSKNSSKSASTGNLQQLNELEREIVDTKESEMGLISTAIGMSPDNPVKAGGDDQVLDLADRLLAQLDAKKEEEGIPPNSQNNLSKIKSPPIPAAGYGSNVGTPIVQPIPIAGASGPPLVPAAVVAGSLPPKSPSSASPHHNIGHAIRKVLSPQQDPPPQSVHQSPHHSNSLALSPTHSTTVSADAPKPNRHAVRKERRKAKDDALRAEAQAEVDATRVNGALDPAEVERQSIEEYCQKWKLVMVEMDPDGHCESFAEARAKTWKSGKLIFLNSRHVFGRCRPACGTSHTQNSRLSDSSPVSS